MKRTTFILFLMLIPIILVSTVNHLATFDKAFHFNNFKNNLMRTWRLNEVIEEEYDNNAWVLESKRVYVYNSVYTTRIDTLKIYGYDTSSSQWILSTKIAYIYDLTGQYVTGMSYLYYFMGMEVPFFRASAQYNPQNRLEMWTVEAYNMGTSQWNLFMWVKMFYNTNSFSSMYYYVPADDPDPQSWDKTTFTNDGAGRPLISINQTSIDSLNWVNEDRIEYNYHDNDTSTGDDFIALLNQMLFSFDYFDTGYSGIQIMFDEITDMYYDMGWENDHREVYTYDTQNRLTELLDRNWDNGWVDERQSLYEYDTNGNLTISTQYTWVARTWMQDTRLGYTFGLDTANDDNVMPVINDLNLTASPNPFYNEVSIRSYSKTTQPVNYSIYNTKGQLIRTISSFSNTKTNWDGRDSHNQTVSNGIYFIKAEVTGKSNTIKVLKLH